MKLDHGVFVLDVDTHIPSVPSINLSIMSFLRSGFRIRNFFCFVRSSISDATYSLRSLFVAAIDIAFYDSKAVSISVSALEEKRVLI